jgi:hypothetical protein
MALLLLMLTLTVGAAGVVLSGHAPTSRASTESSVQTQADLAHAAEAVIAYNLADDANPGALVCPDTSGDGVAGSCHLETGEWFIGRLPWRTLDLPREYRKLWYVIDGDFHDDHNYEESQSDSGADCDDDSGDGVDNGNDEPGECAGTGATSVTALNPGVDGSLSLDGESGYAAIVFDPGEARSGQDRSSGSDDVADYLDGDNDPYDDDAPTNTSASTEYFDCHDMSDCNDRARGISTDELFATVQLRVIGELDRLLRDHYSGPGERPRAAPLGSGSMDCDPNTLEGDVYVGHVPIHEGSCNVGEYIDLDHLDDPSTSGVEGIWIAENDWLDYVVYVVDEGCTDGGSGCGSLRVNGVDGVRGILFGAGPPLPSQQPRSAAIEKYLDLAANTDGDGNYLTSPVTHESNDVIRWH